MGGENCTVLGLRLLHKLAMSLNAFFLGLFAFNCLHMATYGWSLELLLLFLLESCIVHINGQRKPGGEFMLMRAVLKIWETLVYSFPQNIRDAFN